MANHYTVTTFLDATGEKSSFKLHNGAITATSIAGFLTDYAALKTALDNMTVGTLSNDQWVGDASEISTTLPSNLAQREIKLLIVYKGNTSNRKYTVTVPTLDLTKVQFMPGARDAVSLTAPAEMAALVNAMQTIGRSPDSDTETITVLSARVVGRNI